MGQFRANAEALCFQECDKVFRRALARSQQRTRVRVFFPAMDLLMGVGFDDVGRALYFFTCSSMHQFGKARHNPNAFSRLHCRIPLAQATASRTESGNTLPSAHPAIAGVASSSDASKSSSRKRSGALCSARLSQGSMGRSTSQQLFNARCRAAFSACFIKKSATSNRISQIVASVRGMPTMTHMASKAQLPSRTVWTTMRPRDM